MGVSEKDFAFLLHDGGHGVHTLLGQIAHEGLHIQFSVRRLESVRRLGRYPLSCP